MNYPKTAAKAAKLLKKNGTAMTLRVAVPGTYDPATGAESGGTTTEYACYGILTNPYQENRETFFENSRIQSGDKVALVGSDIGVRPQPGNMLLIDSEVWQVLGVIAVAPANVDLLFKLHVRRG